MRTLILGAIVTLTSSAQDLEQFTRARPEHIIVEVAHPFRVRAVAGIVVLKGEGVPIPKVLLEIQGPDGTKKIRHAISGEDGHFQFRHISAGTYRFKATLDGMQSVMGTIEVVKKGESDQEIRIEMAFGV